MEAKEDGCQDSNRKAWELRKREEKKEAGEAVVEGVAKYPNVL